MEQENTLAPRQAMLVEGSQAAPGTIAAARLIADQLAAVIDGSPAKLAVKIGNRRFLTVEAWTTILAMMRIRVTELECKRDEDGSYTARVALIREGETICEASAECGRDEPEWANRPAYSRRSMAITRATGKAARLNFSWIVTLAGFAATPAEEMHQAQSDPPPAVERIEREYNPSNPFRPEHYYDGAASDRTYTKVRGEYIPIWQVPPQEAHQKIDWAVSKGYDGIVQALRNEFLRREKYDQWEADHNASE